MGINKKRFTISVAKKLLYMLEGRALPSSSLPRWIVDELRIEGLITAQSEIPVHLLNYQVSIVKVKRIV